MLLKTFAELVYAIEMDRISLKTEPPITYQGFLEIYLRDVENIFTNWQLIAFLDCGEIDYIEQIKDPSGKIQATHDTIPRRDNTFLTNWLNECYR